MSLQELVQESVNAAEAQNLTTINRAERENYYQTQASQLPGSGAYLRWSSRKFGG